MTKSKTAVKNADEFERLNSKRGEQMKYLGKPAGMWALFAGSFEKHLTVEFDLPAEQACQKEISRDHREAAGI